MKIIFLGAPGAGKGTQAEKTSKRLGIPTISTGVIIREAVKNGTEMGLQAKKLIEQGKLVDDSIVRGTQLKETVDFLYDNGAGSVHMRSACPPIMYCCKYLGFSRSNSELDLIARKTVLELEGEEGFLHLDEYSDGATERGKRLRKTICEKLHFASLEFQSLEGIIKAIGIEPCKLCTYCWNGKE